MVKQTAGRDALGTFAPKFAALNDDVLFGEVWSREDQLSLKMRSIITVTALVSKGMVDSSFQYHLATAKHNGVSKNEVAGIRNGAKKRRNFIQVMWLPFLPVSSTGMAQRRTVGSVTWQ